MQTFFIGLAAVIGAVVGAQSGIGWGIGGFVIGLVLGGVVAVIADNIADKETQRRWDEEERQRWKREREQQERKVASVVAASEAAQTKRAEAATALVAAGHLNDDEARRLLEERWPLRLLTEIQNGTLGFDDCTAVVTGEFKHGLPPAAVALMLGPPDREVKSELKTKTKVTWTYYEDPQSRKGVTFKCVFDDDKLVDFMAAKDERLDARLNAACVKNFGEVGALERQARLTVQGRKPSASSAEEDGDDELGID